MKTKTLFRILLIIVVLVLSILVLRSILRPEKFKLIYEERRDIIKERLMTIRAVEAVYKNEFKTYCSNIDSLVDFVQNGHVNVIKNVGEIPEGMTEADALKKGILKKETVAVPAKDRILETDANLNIESFKDFQYIPMADGKKFTIQTGSIASKTYEIPVYCIDVPLDDILANIDKSITPKNTNVFTRFFNYIFYHGLANEVQYRVQYGNITMGSLTEASTSGNWE
ncbi:MAG: hypothetical protein RR356_02460 [Bacteroidales bacterium]